jgi:hypothetical protein
MERGKSRPEGEYPPGLTPEPDLELQPDLEDDGEAGHRYNMAYARREAEISWLGIINGQLEGSSGETMTITLDAVMTQRMKAAQRTFGKTPEEFLMPFLRMVTAGAICYPDGEWERHPDSPVHTVEEIDRLKEMW